jgi:hypothetical protein
VSYDIQGILQKIFHASLPISLSLCCGEWLSEPSCFFHLPISSGPPARHPSQLETSTRPSRICRWRYHGDVSQLWALTNLHFL